MIFFRISNLVKNDWSNSSWNGYPSTIRDAHSAARRMMVGVWIRWIRVFVYVCQILYLRSTWSTVSAPPTVVSTVLYAGPDTPIAFVYSFVTLVKPIFILIVLKLLTILNHTYKYIEVSRRGVRWGFKNFNFLYTCMQNSRLRTVYRQRK